MTEQRLRAYAELLVGPAGLDVAAGGRVRLIDHDGPLLHAVAAEIEARGAEAIPTPGVASPGAPDDILVLLALPEGPTARVDFERDGTWPTSQTTAFSPSTAWARVRFPDAPDPTAAVWEELAAVLDLDGEPTATWTARHAALAARAARLDGLGLDALRFDARGGEELVVPLHARHRWCPPVGRSPFGTFCPNVPCDEVFTRPAPAGAHGTFVTTAPTTLGGVVVPRFKAEMADGRLVGLETLEGTATDGLVDRLVRSGADRLSEVALVDREGLLAGLERRTGHVLLDENAGSHVALGVPIAGSWIPEADEPWPPAKSPHHDLVLGGPGVRATGLRDGEELLLIDEAGRWRLG